MTSHSLIRLSSMCLQHYEEYDQGSYHEDYSYKSHTSQTNSHPHHLQTGTEHLPTGWDQQNGQNYQYQNGDYAHSSAGTDEFHGTDFSTGDGAEQEVYPNNALQHGAGYHGDEAQAHGEHNNIRHHFQVNACSQSSIKHCMLVY